MIGMLITGAALGAVTFFGLALLRTKAMEGNGKKAAVAMLTVMGAAVGTGLAAQVAMMML